MWFPGAANHPHGVMPGCPKHGDDARRLKVARGATERPWPQSAGRWGMKPLEGAAVVAAVAAVGGILARRFGYSIPGRR
jgi:hypothetical protein